MQRESLSQLMRLSLIKWRVKSVGIAVSRIHSTFLLYAVAPLPFSPSRLVRVGPMEYFVKQKDQRWYSIWSRISLFLGFSCLFQISLFLM